MQQNGSGRMIDVARRVDAPAKLFFLAGEAKRFFVDGVSLKVGEPAFVLWVREAGEDGRGAEVEICGGDCSGDRDEERCPSNQFFRMPQGIRSLRSQA